MGKYTYWLIALVVAVVAIGAGFLLTRAAVIDSAYAVDATLAPTVSDQSGVDVSSAFVFNFDGEVKASSVRKYLTVEPAMELGIHQGQNSSEVLVAPSEPLQPNTVYRFSLKTDGEDAGWAFQTKNVFGVAGVYPGNQTSDVPVNSGIEITFTHRNTIDISPYFQIEPAVEGDFVQHGRTVVFTPGQSLAPDTVYTVTVKAGLPLADTEEKLAEDYTFSFETGSKETQEEINWGWDLQSTSLSFSLDQIPTFSMYSYRNSHTSEKVTIKVYSYASATAYANALQKQAGVPSWAYHSRNDYLPDVSGLEEALDFKANLDEKGQYGDYILSCPAPLPAGYYVVMAEYDGVSRSVFFQVSNLTAYLQPAEGQSLLWVHDLSSGEAVNNATVTFYATGKSAKTDKNGVVTIEIPSADDEDKSTSKYDYNYEAKNDIYFIKSGDQSLIVYDNGYTAYGSQSSANYNWQYLYLDRALYRNSDTVNFWGVFVPRDSSGVSPDTLSVRIYASDDDEPLLTTEVKLSGGTFMGSVNLPNLPSGWYDLEVYNDETYLFGEGFSVEDFIKASYELNATAEKQVILAGDTAVFDLETIGFEGTPMPDIKINYSFLNAQNKIITTDEEGKAQISTSVKQKDTEDQHKQFISYEYFYAYTQTPESGYVYANANTVVLNSALGIDSEGSVKDGKGNVENYIYNVTTDKVNNGEAGYWDEGAFDGGPAAGQKASVKTYHLYWLKTPTGKYYYDYINKINIPIYTYDEKKVLIDQGQIESGTDGKAAYSFDTALGEAPSAEGKGAVVEDRNSFMVETSVTDAKGRTNTSVTYLYGESEKTGPYDDDDWYYLQADKDSYLINDALNVSFKHGDGYLVNEKQSAFLFISAQNGIEDYVVQDKPVYSDTFKAKDVPNIYLTGAYFDGHYYHKAYPLSLAADISQFKLDVDLSFDKEKYAPGDEAVLTVTVKDTDGKGRQAKVNISLVDEAIFKIMEQYNDIESIYAGISSGLGDPLVTNSKSQSADGMGGGGDGAGEAGSSVRDYFPDAVKFVEVQTDKEGKAELKITLPDNITAWRCTANAITPDIEIATVTKDLNVTLPFFSEAISNSAYLDGDKVTIFLRSAGSMAQGKITYNVQVKHSDTVSETTVSTEDNALTPVSLGILHTGEYEIVVKSYSKAGGQDSFSHHLSVVDNFHQINKSASFDMSDPSTIKGSDTYTTRIVISTPYRNALINTLWKNSYSDSLRVESKLASLAAVQLLTEYNDDTFGDLAAPDDTVLSEYQQYDGGIAIMPYANSDLETSVKVASIGGEQFSANKLAAYFESFLDRNENREKQILALAGLASLGEPVLQEINLLKEEQDLTVEEQLYLIWGMLQCGDKQKASAALQAFLDANAQDLGDTMMIKGGDDLTITATRTMWAAMIAAYCGNIDDFFSLFNYVDKADSQDLFAIEEVLCSEGMLPRLSNNGAYFTYTLDGTSHKVELNGKDDYQITLLPEQLSNISFKNMNGNLSAMSYYKDAPSLSYKDKISGVTLKRYYSGGSNGVFSTETTLQVNLYYHLPDYLPEGYYTITDCLPAGVRAIENSPNLLGKAGYYFGSDFTNGQVVSFVIYKEKNKAADDTVIYYARPISAGRFTAQSAILSQGSTGKIYQYTVSNTVTIK